MKHPLHGRVRAIVPGVVPGVVLCLALATGLTGCGSSDTSDSNNAGAASGSGSSASSSTSTLDISIKGDRVEPENKRVKVDLKKGITLQITSDRAGELHVHSSPEQHIEFEAGTTTRKLTFTVPGVIEVEEHLSDSLVAQLEVK